MESVRATLLRSRSATTGVARVLTVLLIASWLIVSMLPGTAEAAGGLKWSWVDPVPVGNDLLDIVYANNQFVAVGRMKTVLTSTDGLNWVTRSNSLGEADVDIVSVTFGHGLYVAVGRYLKDQMEYFVPITSSDGVSWTVHSPQRGFLSRSAGSFMEYLYRDLPRLAFNGSHFVLQFPDHTQGKPALYALSSDGVLWTAAPTFDPALFPGFNATAPGPYATGASGSVALVQSKTEARTHFYTSKNNSSWAERVSVSGRFTDLAYGAGRFVAVGYSGTGYGGRIMASTDGLAWESQVRESAGSLTSYSSAATGNGVAVVMGGDQVLVVASSGNRQVVKLQEYELTRVIFAAGKFIAAGTNTTGVGDKAAIYTSQDGLQWTKRWEAPDPQSYPGGMVAGGNKVLIFINTFSSNGAYPLTSVDGIEWTAHEERQPAVNFMDVAWGNNRFVAVGYKTPKKGVIYTSSDGLTWTARDPYVQSDEFQGVVFAADQFVVVGGSPDRAIIINSRDGISWDVSSSDNGYGNKWLDVDHTNGVFVAVSKSRMAFSEDGLEWSIELAGLGLTMAEAMGNRIMVGGSDNLLFGTVPDCRQVFEDLPSEHPACKAVSELRKRGVISGYPDGSFRPENQVTRAEIAKMLVVTLGQNPNPAGQVTFQDVAGHWVVTQGYLQTAVQIGAVQGYSETSFGPNDPVTRAQLAKLVAAAYGLSPTGTPPYGDVNDWSTGWVAVAHQSKLVGPQAPYPIWTGSTLEGSKPATRAEAAMVLANLLALRK